MSVSYKAVGWNRNKRRYDMVLVVCIIVYLSAFIAASKLTHSGADGISDEVLIIRATGTCAFFMLHVVLCIGPLARLDRRFALLLYNRRHFGVATFLLALVHGVIILLYYHGFGVVNPLVSLLTGNSRFGSLPGFPFQLLGAAALVILFLMAATSHDFWLRNLSPPCWKALHMLVYVAYGLLVLHVVLGALQSERSGFYVAIVLCGFVVVTTLHLMTGVRANRQTKHHADADWIDVGRVGEIAEGQAKVVEFADRQSVAVFRYEGKISALSNVCAHQNGPLGEGRIVSGCVTCPWHGYQYRPQCGQSPPPYTEKVPTYHVRIEGERIKINPQPLPPGTPVEPAMIEGGEDG